ncbi:unnamed protein product [Orchesella dallaii]|uniref:Uncharacterized protein n=1 Tax=Orchesella dallaii TaxID=48710 RepID=A0ABP1PKW7_9HEXA
MCQYIGGALLMYMSGLWALPMWILVDIALSEILFGRACSTVCNSLPLDNPSPVQYSGFLKRFFTTGLSNYLLYNQGYLKHYRVPTTAILLLPGTVSFYLTIMTFNGWRIISSPVETLESNVGAYYLSAFFGIIPIMIFVVERLFTRNNVASLTQQQMLLPEV